MCTDISYQGHIVACVDSNQVQRIDASQFCIGGVKVDFWDAMHLTVIGNKAIIEIPPDTTDKLTWLNARRNQFQNQIELLTRSISDTQKLIDQIQNKETAK